MPVILSSSDRWSNFVLTIIDSLKDLNWSLEFQCLNRIHMKGDHFDK